MKKKSSFLGLCQKSTQTTLTSITIATRSNFFFEKASRVEALKGWMKLRGGKPLDSFGKSTTLGNLLLWNILGVSTRTVFRFWKALRVVRHLKGKVEVVGNHFKGELNPEMKLSQSIELFVTKRLPPIRSLSDVWFSSCASWKSAATPPEFGRDTPFWRHWHSDWPGGDRERVVFRTFRKISAFSSRVVSTGFCRTILRV